MSGRLRYERFEDEPARGVYGDLRERGRYERKLPSGKHTATFRVPLRDRRPGPLRRWVARHFYLG